MKYKMKEKLWKFACVVSEVWCGLPLSLFRCPFDIPTLAAPKKEQTSRVTVSTVSLTLCLNGPCHQISLSMPLVSHSLIDMSNRVRCRDQGGQGFKPLLPIHCTWKCSYELPWTICGHTGTLHITTNWI